ncbi:hypothetical protein BH11PSE2_BH11PSE2_10760 [soil metagenome]
MPRQIAARPDVLVFAEIGAIERLASLRIERLLPAGLSNAQFNVLGRLTDGPLKASDLAAELAVSKAAMTNSLQRLLAAGLVASTVDRRDARCKWIALNPAGEAAFATGAAALRPLMEDLRGSFDPAAFAEALPLLQSLRAWLAKGPQLD